MDNARTYGCSAKENWFAWTHRRRALGQGSQSREDGSYFANGRRDEHDGTIFHCERVALQDLVGSPWSGEEQMPVAFEHPPSSARETTGGNGVAAIRSAMCSAGEKGTEQLDIPRLERLGLEAAQRDHYIHKSKIPVM